LADSLPKAVAQALAALPDNLFQTDQKLDNGLGACWLGRNSLDRIVHSWKSYSAHRANRILGRSGTFWHRDYFDHAERRSSLPDDRLCRE
jgi:putative transposase